MPTKRAAILFTFVIVLYFLANQTQVGWVYIISNGILGLLLVALIYSRGMLKSIQVKRTLDRLPLDPAGLENEPERGEAGAETDDLSLAPPAFHEDDPIEISLHFNQAGFKPALLVSGCETCPFAPVADQVQRFFMPALFKSQPVSLSYQTRCDRRGGYTFPALQVRSKGPFGLFSSTRTLAAPGEILIFPAYYPLKRLRVLEKREFAEWQTSRSGMGSQVIGTREYRTGDAARQIHWRSVARTGRLVVKEFANDDQLTLTVVLDLESGSNLGEGKFSTFETAVRLAASLGYYATHHHIPFRLVGAGKKWTLPAIPLSWWASLHYLAKVENDGERPLAHVLNNLPASTFVVVLVSQPSAAIAGALAALPGRGVQALALLITPDGGAPPTLSVAKVAGLETKWLSPHNWTAVLEAL